MASKEGTAGQAFAPVLAAVSTMQGNVSRTEKTQAHEFLEKFQKSVCVPDPVSLGRFETLCSLHKRRLKLIGVAFSTLGRGVDDYARTPPVPRCSGGGQIICCDYTEGKGELSDPVACTCGITSISLLTCGRLCSIWTNSHQTRLSR